MANEINYKNIDGESSTQEFGYNNLLTKEGVESLQVDANNDATNDVDLSNGINSSNSQAIIGTGSVDVQQTTLVESGILNTQNQVITNIINTNLDTESKIILGEFTFGASGALKMATDDNNGVWISPTGILGKQDGANTFTLGIDGTANFAGNLSAPSGTLGNISISGYILGGQTAYNTGTGFFLGYSGGVYKFSIGVPTGDYLTWDGTNLKVSTSGIIKNFTAGETINGATLPVPVYINNADTRVYACDANAQGKLKYFGFAISNSTAGNSINVQISGVIPGFSSLTIGAIYYISDTVGTISTTPGTLQIPIGIAVSATQIKMIDFPIGALVAGDILMNSSNVSTTPGYSGQSYIKCKEMEVVEAGTYRIKFDVARGGAANQVYGQIYKNGVAYGTERTIATGWSEDLSFLAGDLIQIYMKSSNPGTEVFISNFQVYTGYRNSLLVTQSNY